MLIPISQIFVGIIPLCCISAGSYSWWVLPIFAWLFLAMSCSFSSDNYLGGNSLSLRVKVCPFREDCLSLPRGKRGGQGCYKSRPFWTNSQLGIFWMSRWYKFGLQSPGGSEMGLFLMCTYPEGATLLDSSLKKKGVRSPRPPLLGWALGSDFGLSQPLRPSEPWGPKWLLGLSWLLFLRLWQANSCLLGALVSLRSCLKHTVFLDV